MAKIKKKTTQLVISQEHNTQAQPIFDQYHEIAEHLHASTNQEQVEAALSEINNMPEGAQVALLKALSKEHHTDAADVLVAINELSPIKDIRKEARRSLIRLEEVRTYPQWSPPIDRTPTVQVTPPSLRFWKGMVTDSRDMSWVELALCFEQEDNPSQVRILVFSLDFLHDGVKDFFTRTGNKRTAENFFYGMETDLPGVTTKDCSLAQARRLILEALDANKHYGTATPRDYHLNISLINQLVLEAPGLEEEEAELEDENEEEETIDLHGLSPEGVIINFVEFWVNGDFDLAYELLSTDSALREGLSKDEWVERREDWLEEADPGELHPEFIHEREPQESKLWLPGLVSARRSTTRKEIEVGWSIELVDTPLGDTLPELPQAIVIYEETERHWFWTSYTLIQEEDEWRIQGMTDEAAIALTLPIEELQRTIEEHDAYLDDFIGKRKLEGISEEEARQKVEAVRWRIMQTIYYTDVLIKKLPLDRSLYIDIYTRLLVTFQFEHTLVSLEPLAHRFTEEHEYALRLLAETQIKLSNKFFDAGDDERGERFQELAEENFREALAIGDSFEVHISLAEILIDRKERLDEAKDHLLRAKALVTDPADDAHIELHLGEIAFEQKQYEDALNHYQRVADFHSDSAESWADLALTYRMLKNIEEAEANYRRAIELEPGNEDYYFFLSEMYSENKQSAKAIEVIEEGLIHNPDSALLHMYLAMRYLEIGDYRQAEIFIEKAERLDPEVPMGKMVHEVIDVLKHERRTPFSQTLPKLGRSGKKKKGR
ncbi:MAG TPA: tetratricopeptide repeat protein [Ktedonobacteraceae bacterium]